MNGEIWWVDFGVPFGSEPGLRRPSVIVQSDSFNNSEMNTTVVIPMTSNTRLADFPGNVLLLPLESGLSKDSVVVTPQITVIDKARLVEKVGTIKKDSMMEIIDGIKILFGIE